MIDKTPIPGHDLNYTEAKAQINNFWNYLDELAAKNSEAYKNFIKVKCKKEFQWLNPSKKKNQMEKILLICLMHLKYYLIYIPKIF